jgi:Xaa-Pro aminopeptidase
MIVTNEPGYYEDGQFGIRIENCMIVVRADTRYQYSSTVNFLRFEPLTLVPIQREFIDVSLLSIDELNWLNEYHAKCASIIGDQLKKLNKINIYNWLIEQTKPF